MTDANFAELRRGMELLLRAMAAGRPVFLTHPSPVSEALEQTTLVFQAGGAEGADPPLPQGQAFALTVLGGEPDAVIANALADYLLDRGTSTPPPVTSGGGKRSGRRLRSGCTGRPATPLAGATTRTSWSPHRCRRWRTIG